MTVITNRVEVDSVEERSENGQKYLVAPVVLVRSMMLNGPGNIGEVYLPQEEITRSASFWDGVPVPINHPSDSGTPISIDDDRASVPIIGEVRNPEAVANGEELHGELWVNIEQATNAGSEGERVINRLKNGDAIEVSTGFAPGRIVAGRFDGEQRQAAALDIQPDHLAVLPNDKGKCSISEGCGAGAPVANAIMVPWTDDGATPEEAGHQVEDTPIDPENLDNSAFERLGRKVANALGISDVEETTEAESSTENEADGTTQNMSLENESMIEELASNTEFDRENLEAWDGTECLQNLYETHIANDGGDGGEEAEGTEETTENETMNNDLEEKVAELEEKAVTKDELTKAMSEALAANREQEKKREIATEIVANSDEYEDAESVLEDYPTEKALQTKRDDITASDTANWSAQLGARETGSSDTSDFPSPIASQRAKQMESDD